MKSIVAVIAITLMTGSAFSGESYSVLEGIPSEAMSNKDMDEIQGKFSVPCVVASICGAVGGNVLPGNWNWTSGLFHDTRTNYPQIWYPSYPASYPWARFYPWGY